MSLPWRSNSSPARWSPSSRAPMDELRKQSTYPIRMPRVATRDPDRRFGRTDAAGKPLALAGDDRRGHAVYRIVRHRVGHHRRVSRTGHRRLGNLARGRARHLRSADHHCCRIVRRHSRRHRLQHVHPAHPRVRRAHGRLQPGADQRSGARAGRSAPRTAEAVERR